MMKNLFRKLFAPLAVIALVFGASISTINHNEVVGAKAEILTDTLQIKGWGGYTNSSFSSVGVDYTGTAGTSGASVAMQIFNGGTGAVRGNQSSMSGNFNVRNTTEYPGYIRKITLKATSTGANYLVTESARSLLSLSATPFDGSSFPTAGAITADVISATLYTVTWTVPTGTNYKYFKLHSLKTAGTVLAAGADAITIEYEPVTQSFGTLDRIEVSGGITSYLVGDTFTNSGLIVTAFDTTNFSKTVTSYTTNKTGYTFLASDVGTVTVTVSYTEGTTKTATFDVSVSQVVQFTKITAASSLYLGSEYVIVAEGATTPKIMNTTFTTFFGQTDVTITSDKVVNLAAHQIVKLVISPTTGTYGFQLVNGDQAGKFLALTSDSNTLNTVSELDTTSSWFVSFDSGNVIINSASFPARNIKYNNSSPRFATYTTDQTPIQLFLNLDTVDHSASANMFVNEVNSGKGATAFGTCEATYEFLESIYNRLGTDAKNIVDSSIETSFVNARTRMAYLEAWIASQPSSPGLQPDVTSSQPFQSSTFGSILLIGVIGVTSVAGYYFLKRKGQAN